MANTRDRITDTAENVRPTSSARSRTRKCANVKNAFAAARNIYDELIGARGVTYAATRMATDKADLQGVAQHSTTCATRPTASRAGTRTRAGMSSCS